MIKLFDLKHQSLKIRVSFAVQYKLCVYVCACVCVCVVFWTGGGDGLKEISHVHGPHPRFCCSSQTYSYSVHVKEF